MPRWPSTQLRRFSFDLARSKGLARSVLEAASQAVWIMTADSSADLAGRHLRLMHSDYKEQKKAYRLQGDRIDAAEEQLQRFQGRVEESAVAADVEKDINYVTMIRGAADALKATGKDVDADDAEYVWRLASGSTHGKRWVVFELNHVEALEEYEPGQLRVSRTARLAAAFRALALAYEVTHFGVAVFGARSGLDYFEAQRKAVLQVAREIPVDPSREMERQQIIEHLTAQ